MLQGIIVKCLYIFSDVCDCSGASPAPLGYIGREVDSESDLGAYGVRNYESATGRFLSTDPLWELYPALTPYQYAANNPISNIDYNGAEIWIATGQGDETLEYVNGVLF